MSESLFVYGTLLPTHAPSEIASVVRRLRRVGAGHVQGRLYDFGDYPGAILDSSSGNVISGEVFNLQSRSVLPALDLYEGFDAHDPENSLFIRTRSTATLLDGREIECWVYVYNRDPGNAPLIVGGDYEKSEAA